MKKILLISALLTSALNNPVSKAANPPDIAGMMNCEIKSISIHEINDGIPKDYNKYKGREGLGDSLSFEYRISDSDKKLFIRLSRPQQDEDAIAGGVGSFDYKYLKDNYTNALMYSFDESPLYGGYLSFGKDGIRMQEAGGTFMLNRYYKSDWNGFLIRPGLLETSFYYFTIDCRHLIDKIDEVYKKISEWENEKYPGSYLDDLDE